MPSEHWHAFWGEGGDVFVGEVSTVNDDNTDNLFEDPRIGRFSRHRGGRGALAPPGERLQDLARLAAPQNL